MDDIDGPRSVEYDKFVQDAAVRAPRPDLGGVPDLLRSERGNWLAQRAASPDGARGKGRRDQEPAEHRVVDLDVHVRVMTRVGHIDPVDDRLVLLGAAQVRLLRYLDAGVVYLDRPARGGVPLVALIVP